MPRGFSWCLYVTNAGQSFALWVAADRQTDANRGWVITSDPSVPPLPRGWTPRRVYGIDDQRRYRSCRVASLSAPLWTGAVTTFSVRGADGISHTVNVLGRTDESTRYRPR